MEQEQQERIDLSALEGALLTDSGSESDLEHLKANGPRSLPPNPTASKWSYSAIIKQLASPSEINFAWLKKLTDAIYNVLCEIKELVEENSVYSAERDAQGNVIHSTYATDSSAVHKTGDETIAGAKTFETGVCFNQGATFGGPLGKAGTEYTVTIPNKSGTLATIEEVNSYHRFRTDSEGYIYQVAADGEDEETSDNRVMNHADGVAMANELRLLKEVVVALFDVKSEERGLIDKIIQGTLTAGYASRADRASHDGEGNLIDVTQYGNSVSLSYEQATGKLTVKLYNKAGREIDSKVIDLPSELVFIDEYYDSTSKKLVFVPASGGSNIEIPLDDLVDTYTEGTDPEGIAVVSINDHVIKVSIADGSISMAKLSSLLQTTWNGWVSAEAARVLAEQGRVAAEAQRVANENARLAMPHLDIDNQGYLIINYGSGRDITID